MSDPFLILGIEETSDETLVRHAYHRMARKWHPDQFQDEAQREEANRRMVALNHAYEKALAHCSPKKQSSLPMVISCEDALELGGKMLDKGFPESALQQLLRASSRSAAWYAMQGKVLMEMSQYESAEQSYREAVRMEPDNIRYRAGALDALVALRESKTLGGRLRQFMGKKKR
ncbi:MAG: DnaJ domain-containing protein [Clostridia bacterium]|nr:DnaJ domain-containing protein [Clostridia bacterium]